MIPNITIESFEEVYIEHVCDVLRLSSDELRERLESTDTTSLNKKAERYITTYLRNNIENLTDDNWLSSKDLFIQWKLFEGIELERESEDKKISLHELLSLFREEISKYDEEGGKKQVAKLVVVSD